ncbi:unnamed protein product [Knipowitschia caucasica]
MKIQPGRVEPSRVALVETGLLVEHVWTGLCRTPRSSLSPGPVLCSGLVQVPIRKSMAVVDVLCEIQCSDPCARGVIVGSFSFHPPKVFKSTVTDRLPWRRTARGHSAYESDLVLGSISHSTSTSASNTRDPESSQPCRHDEGCMKSILSLFIHNKNNNNVWV